MEITTINKESAFIDLPVYNKQTQISNATIQKERSKELREKKFKYGENDFQPHKRSSYREDAYWMTRVGHN